MFVDDNNVTVDIKDGMGHRDGTFTAGVVPTYMGSLEDKRFMKMERSDFYQSTLHIDAISATIAPTQNNVWAVFNRQHWDPKEFIFVDFDER